LQEPEHFRYLIERRRKVQVRKVVLLICLEPVFELVVLAVLRDDSEPVEARVFELVPLMLQHTNDQVEVAAMASVFSSGGTGM